MKSTWTIKDKHELLFAIDRKMEIHQRKIEKEGMKNETTTSY